MQELTLLKPLTLHSGFIGLTEEQAKDRAHCLIEAEDEAGIYEIKSAVQFKSGEVIELEEVPKGFDDYFAEISEAENADEAEAEAKAKAEAEAKAKAEAEAKAKAEKSNK
jgi:colicin import membrane protein